MRNQPLLQGLWLRDWFAHAPDRQHERIQNQRSAIADTQSGTSFFKYPYQSRASRILQDIDKDIFRTMFQIADRRLLIAEPEAPRVLRLFSMWVR
jgi:hypothetical protein